MNDLHHSLAPAGVGAGERRRAEHVAIALEASGLGTWEWDLRTGRVWWSPAIARAHGLEPGEFGGTMEALERLVHPGDVGCLRTALSAAIRAGEPASVQYRARLGDGSSRWMELTGAASIGEDGQPDYMAGLSADITDRIRAKQGDAFLAEASQILSGTMDYDKSLALVGELAVPELAEWCVIDLVPEVTEHDDSSTRRVSAVHATPAEVRLVRSMEFEKPQQEGLPFFRPPALTAGTAELVEDLTVRRREGLQDGESSRRIAELGIRSYLTVPLRTEGRVLGALTLATASSGRHYDREDLRRAHRLAHHLANALERAAYHRRAEQAIAVRNEVLAIVSHDLRNPLNTIQLASSLLREEVGNPAARPRLDAIDRSVRNAGRLIRDLLDVARAEAGGLSIITGPTRVVALLREVESNFAAAAESASVTLEVDCASETDAVVADRARIVQVLSNLVANALRHTPAGGKIRLVAKRQRDAYQLSVCDNGPGVPVHQRRSLFRPFAQERNGSRAGAAGLGLAIARAIVVAHGGSIWLDEACQIGAAFCFTLPHAGGKKHKSGRMRAIET